MTERVRIVKEVKECVGYLREQLENGEEICRNEEKDYLIGPYRIDEKVKKLHKKVDGAGSEWEAKFNDAMGQYLEEIVPLIRICLNEEDGEQQLEQIARIEELVEIKLENVQKINLLFEISSIRGKAYYAPFSEIFEMFHKTFDECKIYQDGENHAKQQEKAVKRETELKETEVEKKRPQFWDEIQNTTTDNYGQTFSELLKKIQELLRTWELILGWS